VEGGECNLYPGERNCGGKLVEEKGKKELPPSRLGREKKKGPRWRKVGSVIRGRRRGTLIKSDFEVG